MNHTYLITGDDGEPIGVADMDQVVTAGTQLAFKLAGARSEYEVEGIQAAAVREHGKAFGYVAASALGVVVREILHPTFEVCRAHGTDVQAGMRAIAEGRQP